jgi:hypothetical protein
MSLKLGNGVITGLNNLLYNPATLNNNSFSYNTWYQNTTGNDIQIFVQPSGVTSGYSYFSVYLGPSTSSYVQITQYKNYSGSPTGTSSQGILIPNGWYYKTTNDYGDVPGGNYIPIVAPQNAISTNSLSLGNSVLKGLKNVLYTTLTTTSCSDSTWYQAPYDIAVLVNPAGNGFYTLNFGLSSTNYTTVLTAGGGYAAGGGSCPTYFIVPKNLYFQVSTWAYSVPSAITYWRLI